MKDISPKSQMTRAGEFYLLGRRVLSLSGKDFPPLDGVNMGNISKSLLKQDIAEQEQWANYYQRENKELKASLEEMQANFKQAKEQITCRTEKWFPFISYNIENTRCDVL